jgi:hypothetical protein
MSRKSRAFESFASDARPFQLHGFQSRIRQRQVTTLIDHQQRVTNMPCLLALFALAAPRLVIACLFFLTTWFNGLFPSLLYPVLGFIFLPTTLLWYTAVVHWFGGQWTLWPVIGLIIALIIDVSPASHRRRVRTVD